MVSTNHAEMVSRKQTQLAYRAKSRETGDTEQQFTALYGLLLWEPWLEVALEQVLSNTGAKTPGVDGITKEDLKSEKNQKALLDKLRDELRTEQYRPQPAKRVYIPKANGDKRPLGIPTIRDRVVQAAVKNLLEPIFEVNFEDCSYGFRPNRNCWDALAEIGQYVKRPSNYEWVVEGDIQDCFGSIDHKVLMRQIRRRIKDPRLLTLIWHLLKAGVMEDLRYYDTEAGTPQGGIVSPLLANIYMHQLDEWAAQRSHRLTERQKGYRRSKGQASLRLTRYADDFTIAVKGTREQAEEIKAEVAEYLATTMRMSLSLEKTRITHRTEGFDFLGITVRYGKSWSRKDKDGNELEYVYFVPSRKAIRRYKAKTKELTSKKTDQVNTVEVIRAYNRFNKGWVNYYRHANSAKLFETLDHWTWWTIFQWLQHRYETGPREIATRNWVEAKTPINRHPTRNDRRLGAWDAEDRHLAIEMLAFTAIRYWKYRGSRIPQKFEGVKSNRKLPEIPSYATQPWTEGENPHSRTESRNAREIVRQRDNGTCQKCGIDASLTGEVHHIDGNARNNDLDNLELLCRRCHKSTTSYGRHKV